MKRRGLVAVAYEMGVLQGQIDGLKERNRDFVARLDELALDFKSVRSGIALYRLCKNDVAFRISLVSAIQDAFRIAWNEKKISGLRRRIVRFENELLNQLSDTNHASPRRVIDLIELISKVLPTSVRRRAFEPAFSDLKFDYVTTRKFEGLAATRWLMICFGIRGMLMIGDSFRVWLGDQIMKAGIRAVCNGVRRWWLGV